MADNQEITSYGIKNICKELGDVKIETVSNQKDLLDVLNKLSFPKVILDYALFDILNIDSLLIMQDVHEDASWLFFSENFNINFLRRIVWTSSKSSFISKEAPVIEIRIALKTILKGERYISSAITENLLRNEKQERTISVLTPTEKEILKSIALGKTTKEIANERSCSVHTITTHRKNIYEKLDISTIYEATQYALKSGLIEIAEYCI
jgi:DNA-binding NarL/FixJ family response regulator